MPTNYNITKIQLPNGDTCTLPDRVKYIDVSKSGTTYSLPSGTTYTSIKALMDDNYICILRVPSYWGYEYFYSIGDYEYIHDEASVYELSFFTYSDPENVIRYARISAPSNIYITSVPILNPSLAGLTDTTITSPTDGQILVYNGTSGKWENTSGSEIPLQIVTFYYSNNNYTCDTSISVIMQKLALGWEIRGQYVDVNANPIEGYEFCCTYGKGDFTNTNTAGNTVTFTADLGDSVVILTGTIASGPADTWTETTNTIPTTVSDLTNDRFVRYDTDSQGLTSTQQSNARTNIGAGTSNFSGSYNDLTNKPSIPTNSDFSLAGLNDTTISSPANGQTLTYNSASGKWVNTSPSNGYFIVSHIIKSYTEFYIDSNYLSDGDVAWSLSDESFYTFDLYNYTWNEDSSLNAQAYDGMIIYSATEGAFYIYNINESLKAISKGTPVITETNDGESNFEQCIYLPVCDSSGDIYITPTSHSGSDYNLIIYGLYGTETCPLEQCGSDHVITIFNTTNNDMTYTLQGDLYIGGEYDNIMSGVDDTTNSFVVPSGGVAEVNVHVTKYESNGAYVGGILNIIVKTDSVWNKITV